MKLKYYFAIVSLFTFSQTHAVATDLYFSYKGVALGSSEKDFKKKHKDASCFTNPTEKTRECIIRNTTYMNFDVEEVRAIFPLDQLGQVSVTFPKSIMFYDTSTSSDENANAMSTKLIMCAFGDMARKSGLEQRYGPYHKDFIPQSKPGGGVITQLKLYWYGKNGNLAYRSKDEISDANTLTCTSEIDMQLNNFYEMMEKAKFGKRLIDDM